MSISRRNFLRGFSGSLAFFTAAASLQRLAGVAHAADTSAYSGYRAIVSVFLLGGNDGYNVLVPLGSGSGSAPYSVYAAARPTIAIPHPSDPFNAANPPLLPISPSGDPTDSYGVHPKLAKLKARFDAGKLAFVANVGPLVTPLTQADYNAGAGVPENLFSHSDQQDAWASSIANPFSISTLAAPLVGAGPTGWGGRVADKIEGLNPGDYPDVTAFGGKALFAVGAERKPIIVSSDGVLALKETGTATFDTLRRDKLDEILGITNGVLPEEAYSEVFSTVMDYSAARTAARDTAWLLLSAATRTAIDAAFDMAAHPTWSLNTQLYQVIRDMVAGATPLASGGLGLVRQIFSVGVGGFDTHSNQRAAQDALLEQLDFALDAFYTSLLLLQGDGLFSTLPPQATLFTMSDFGRTLKENSDGGTDHGWGNHMMVLGDRVAGGKIYGTFPTLGLDPALNPDVVDVKGRLLPSASVEQYAFTFAHWMGLTALGERNYVFPNLKPYVDMALAANAAAPGTYPPLTEKLRFTALLT